MAFIGHLYGSVCRGSAGLLVVDFKVDDPRRVFNIQCHFCSIELKIICSNGYIFTYLMPNQCRLAKEFNYIVYKL